MSHLIWSPQALRDVQRLYRFLASKNVDAARRAITTVRQQIKILAHQPGIGRPIDDLPETFREWVIDFSDSGYVARYRIDAETVTVLGLRHQKEVGF